MNNPIDDLKQKTENSVVFIKEVAKYFMDFLETDFHKRKNPKRSIKLRSEDNLLIGINIGKYPSFNDDILKLISHNFTEGLNKIQKGVYKTNIPQNLLDLVKLQVKKIDANQINTVLLKSSEEIEKSLVVYNKEFDRALSNSLEEVSLIIKNDFVLPFVSNLEKPLDNLKLADENSIFLMEEELTEILTKLLEQKISVILQSLIAGDELNIQQELESVFSLQDIKNTILEFFENFKINDVFSEVFEMERNRDILDKQEFYLYFCDITFNSAKYPIFYIPFNVVKQNDLLSLEFDSQVYINKKSLEYIVQEYNNLNGTKGSLKSITERIIYLAQYENNFKDLIDSILNEIVNFFELDKNISISDLKHQEAKSIFTRVSNSCYICLFDKSDEALINDYEDILGLVGEDNVLGAAFDTLVQDFIYTNPKSFNKDVEDDWDQSCISDKLVSVSPIPLNSEQRQILSAINKDDCKYIIIEGPPGTGKSHTITAIVFDTILKNQSVLVLSDKKEALDVVEEKITETMNKVRMDKDFQNPILRLGKTGSTYAQILSSSTIEKIKLHHRAVKKEHEELEQNINKATQSLKEDIDAEILSYKDINLKEISELTRLEDVYNGKNAIIEIEEFLLEIDSAYDLEEFRRIIQNLEQLIGSNVLLNLFKFNANSFVDIADFKNFIVLLEKFARVIESIKESCLDKIYLLDYFTLFSDSQIDKLGQYLRKYEAEHNLLFGYLFKRKVIEDLDNNFLNEFAVGSINAPHKNLQKLKDIEKVFKIAESLKYEIDQNFLDKIDYLNVIHKILLDGSILSSLDNVVEFSNDIDYLSVLIEKYPKTFKKLGIKMSVFPTLIDNKLIKIDEISFNNLVRFITLKQKVRSDFSKVPDVQYLNQQKDVESLVTTQMAYIMDGRVIDFYDNNKATAKTLRDIIKNKQRFPKDEFLKLKEAFPCILAGIRDYAEYIPLEPGIFDLVIIDEASQVSIAQAFPALMRAKKVLILGDKKQFSNIKAAQAKSDTNAEYLNNLRRVFVDNISDDTAKLSRLDKFNIKTSILEFFEFISNYNIQLLKHFRGYKEIISYSNKYFYQDSLQVMKIRGKSIDDVIKFTNIEHDGKIELNSNTNILEIEFIISELEKLKAENSEKSIGIITPHTDQQKLIYEKINQLPERDYYFDKFKLKIMTFDTCQGEERDIIYYSMVANPQQDRLWGVFIKDLNSVDIEEDGKIKAQRLNVGFSRAKECMHFILSKPLSEYTGSIGDALRHYYFILEEAKKEKDVSDVDSKSKMEPEVLNWFYQTKFWKENKNSVDFIPQFKIGEYLRQLDPRYNHPDYIVDFLLIYRDLKLKDHKIIIEYDGFSEHFKDQDGINGYNYENYYSEDDVYRQKVLESYGYKFLRINRFNVGVDPIGTLNERIGDLIVGKRSNNDFLDGIHETIEGLQNGQMKECPKCKEIREQQDFRDPALLTGYGRFCKYCKSNSVGDRKKTVNGSTTEVTNKICPRCGATMLLRRGRYGKFYGCSKFPYCKSTLR